MHTGAVILAIIVILIGIAGVFIPYIPGIPLIFIAILAYGWYEGFHQLSAYYIAVIAALTILSLVVDYLGATLGAKYFGSSKMGVYGALLGSLLGIIIFAPIGIFVGPWLGALVGEMLAGKDFSTAMRVSMGTIAGLFSGIAFNLVLGTAMFISFLSMIF